MHMRFAGIVAHSRRAILAPLLALALLSCASVEEAEPPSIQLSNIALKSAGLFRQALALELRIGNPNDFDVPLNGLTFTLDVNGREFASGLSNESVTLPRLGFATVNVDGNTDTLSVLRELMALGQSDRIRYRLHGTAYVGYLGQNKPVPYDRKGELSLLPENAPRPSDDTLRTLVPASR